MDWAQEEFESLELGDARLKRRAVQLVQRLGQKPGQSIPNACGNWAETAAAYRFLSNEQVKWQPVMDAHFKASQARMRQHKVVLCIQDTTELDYNRQQIKGLGPLNYEARRGLYLHPTWSAPSVSHWGSSMLGAGRERTNKRTAAAARCWRVSAGSRATSDWPSELTNWGAHGKCAWETGSQT